MLTIFRFLNRKTWAVYSLSAALFLPGILFAASAQDGGAGPEVSAASVVERYPPGSIRSVSAAELALAEVTKERSVVEAHFATEQNICYSKFFASACMNDAKERRRAALEKLRAVEVEANLFLRQARAEQRDRSLAQKREKEDAERVEREQRAASEAEKRGKAGERSGSVSEPQGVPDLDRAARHGALREGTRQ
jgi:hypothetical protein